MARSLNPLSMLTGVFGKLEAQAEKTNELLDEAVDLLFSIDKKMDKQSRGTKIAKGAGKEVAVALDSITNLVKELNKSKAKNVDEVLNKIVEGVGKLEEKAKGFNESAAAFNKNLLGLGVAVLGFSAMILLATPALIIGLPVMALAGLVVWGWSKLFESIDTKKFKEGTDAMLDLAKTTAVFGLSLLVYKLVEVSDIIKAGLGIIVVGGALALLTKIGDGKKMERAAKGLMFAGASIASIGLGLWLFQKLDIQWETIAMASVAVVGTGLALALAGKFWKHIAKGALVMSLASIPLMMIGFSLDMFAKSISSVQQSTGMGGWEFLGLVAATVGTIGIEMGLAGLAFPFIAAGAGAMILAGGAIYSISAGLDRFAKINFDEEQSKNLSYALGAVRAAFLGTDGKDEGFLSKLGGVFTGAMDSVRMLEAAAGFAAAGMALTSLSKGLTKFAEVGWKEEDSENLGIVLGTIQAAFAQAGGEPANPGGLFGAVFGNAFSPNATERGIDSVMGAGDALLDISKGLIEFQKLIDMGIVFGDPDDPKEGTMAYAVINTLGFVQKAFSAIGKDEETDGWGFFSWDENNVEKGIDAVRGAGKELTNIAEGLMSFQDLIDREVKFGDPNDPKEGTLAYAVINTLGFVQKAFGAIGKDEEEDGWWIFSWDENNVEKGIDAVKGAGEELTNIANGLMGFQDLIDREVKFGDPNNPIEGTLAYAVINTLGFVQKAFGAIGADETSDEFLFFSWDENNVEKGIDSVKGAGEELRNIADSLMIFQDLIEKEVKFGDPKNPVEGTLAYAVINTLGFVEKAFAAIGSEETDSIFWWGESDVEKGIERIKGSGEELKNISDSLVNFQEMIKNEVKFGDVDNPEEGTLAWAILMSLGAVQKAFAKIGAGETDGAWFWEESLVQKGIERVKGAGEELSNIATGMKTFSEITDPEALGNTIRLLFGTVSDFFTEQAQSADGLKSTMYFSMFSSGIVAIGDKADKFTKIAESFEKMAKSMGEFKDNVNDFDLEKLTIVDSLFYNMQQLAKIDGGIDAMSQELVDAINQSFEKLGEFLQDIATNTDPNNAPPSVAPGQAPTPTPDKNGGGNQNVAIDPQLIAKIDQLRTALLSGIPVTVSNIGDI